MLRTAIIIGSTRPGRKGDAVAKWASATILAPSSLKRKISGDHFTILKST